MVTIKELKEKFDNRYDFLTPKQLVNDYLKKSDIAKGGYGIEEYLDELIIKYNVGDKRISEISKILVKGLSKMI